MSVIPQSESESVPLPRPPLTYTLTLQRSHILSLSNALTQFLSPKLTQILPSASVGESHKRDRSSPPPQKKSRAMKYGEHGVGG